MAGVVASGLGGAVELVACRAGDDELGRVHDGSAALPRAGDRGGGWSTSTPTPS
ncbi:MAG: hypothetical protein R2695_06570 [Acidimicrobiales bacterium]